MMKLYAVSGLGADERVFQYLDLDAELIPVQWINPASNENLADYALRLSNCIKKEEKYGIIGVSFGGLVAVELSKILQPQLTILISSAETKKNLRPIYRLLSKTHILKLIPSFLFNPPLFIASKVFGTNKKSLLKAILDDTDLKFAKWAANALISWNNTEILKNPTLKINGTKDLLIPHSPNDNNQHLIHRGHHFMIVDRAIEISKIINNHIAKLNP